MDFSEYSKKYIHYYDDKIPAILSFVFNSNEIKRIADFGPGDGALLCALKNKGYLDNVEEIIAVDLSQDRINRVKKFNKDILCIVGDLNHLPIHRGLNLDLIISTQVIEHLPEEEKFLEGIYNTLKVKGLLYLSTVFKKKYAWYFYRNKGKWVIDPTHLREYTEREQLLRIVEKFDFKILEESRIMHQFPLIDFFLKRLGFKGNVYKNSIIKFLRFLKVPILGYYNWELVLKKMS